jgi:hypothetical protein
VRAREQAWRLATQARAARLRVWLAAEQRGPVWRKLVACVWRKPVARDPSTGVRVPARAEEGLVAASARAEEAGGVRVTGVSW